jgi:hypothetical protein
MTRDDANKVCDALRKRNSWSAATADLKSGDIETGDFYVNVAPFPAAGLCERATQEIVSAFEAALGRPPKNGEYVIRKIELAPTHWGR